MMLSVTPIYAILLTGVFLFLSARVIMERRSNRIAYGDNDSPRIQAKIRAQANWSEYVPISLLLMLMAELQGASTAVLHIIGLFLLLGRGLHGYSMSVKPRWFPGRFWGMILTFGAMAVALVALAISTI